MPVLRPVCTMYIQIAGNFSIGEFLSILTQNKIHFNDNDRVQIVQIVAFFIIALYWWMLNGQEIHLHGQW